jgi:hypothetical protein
MTIKLTKQIAGASVSILTIILDFTAQTFTDLSVNPSAAASRVGNWELEGRRLSLLRQGWEETVLSDEEAEIEDIFNKFAA